MPKKVSKKLVVKKVESESESDEEIHDEDESSHDSTDVKIPTGLILSSEDQKSMIDQVLLQIKKDEQCISKSFLKVLNNIKWDLIHIPGFTPDQLNKEFLTLIKPVKKTRTLTEVLNDFTLNSNKYLTDLADDYPKYPLTAFNLFCNVYREKIVKKLGDKLTLGDISKACSEKFKTLSEEKRKSFSDQAKLLRDEYNLKLVKFYKDHPELAVKKDAKSKKVGNSSRKSDTPLNLFITKKEEETGKAINRAEAKVKWENLDIQEKANIIREVLSHNNTNRKVTKDELNLLDEALGIPKRPQSAFNFFLTEFTTKNKKKIQGKNIFKVSSEAWNELSLKQKEVFNERHKTAYENYVKDYEVYLQSLPPSERTNERIKFEKAHKKKLNTLIKLEKERKQSSTDVGSLLNGTKSLPTTSTPAPEKSKKRLMSEDSDEDEIASPKKLKFVSPIKKEFQTDSDSSPKKKKREANKLSDSDSSPSKKKKTESDVDAAVSPAKKKKKKKTLMAPEYPPQSAQLYFMKNQFFGKPGDAKAAYKKLSKKELRKIQQKVEEATESYKTVLRDYVKTLTTEQGSEFQAQIHEKVQRDAKLMRQFDGVEDSTSEDDSDYSEAAHKKPEDLDDESDY